MIWSAKYTIIFFLIYWALPTFSQTDSLKKKLPSVQFENDTNTIFQNKKLTKEEIAGGSKLEIGAYVSVYYACYTEDNTTEFVKYPTMAARNNQFGLNMAMISLAYKSQKVRSTVALHYGDIPESAWATKFNMIQEANAGIELTKNLWLDAGVFKSHIGLESTQPRENITSSMTLANVYEPYFFSGAKLTYLLNSKLSLQLNAFNSFNSIVETNKNKLIGASIVFAPTENLSLTYNFITGDDTPDSIKLKHQRYYNNLYLTYQKKKVTFGVELNYGLQEYSKQIDPTTVGTATMNSALLVLKHQTFKKAAFYLREEWFSDKDEMLSAGSDMGTYTFGTTAGIEYKPLKNTAICIEGRNLTSENPNFKYNNEISNQRWEGIICLDVWF